MHNLFEIFFTPTLLFFIGIFGITFNNKNFLNILFCIEIMFLGLTLIFSIYAFKFQCTSSLVFILYILTIAAAESVVGLGIIIAAYREKQSIDLLGFLPTKG